MDTPGSQQRRWGEPAEPGVGVPVQPVAPPFGKHHVDADQVDVGDAGELVVEEGGQRGPVGDLAHGEYGCLTRDMRGEADLRQPVERAQHRGRRAGACP